MRILVTAKLANTTAGHIDHALAYAVGFRELGHEVLVIDYAGSGRCVDATGARVPFEQWSGRLHFEAVMRRYGLWPRASLVSHERQTHGLPWDGLVRLAKSADLLIVRSGKAYKLPEIFDPPRVRLFFDGNPGQTQSDFATGSAEAEPLERFEHLFTLGLNVGAEDCPVPCSGLRWHRLPRPMPLSMWPAAALDGQRFTTISTWKGRAKVALDGWVSGDKADNWLAYLDLPRRTGTAFEIALRMGPEHAADRQRFLDGGWQLADPTAFDTFDRYREYIAASKAEFSVAHDRYVALETGWFSDRSAAYLASGRPAVVQATGFEAHLPVGLGLLTFRTADDAAECVARVEADYAMHARAARAIAQAHLSTDRVLRQVLSIVAGG